MINIQWKDNADVDYYTIFCDNSECKQLFISSNASSVNIILLTYFNANLTIEMIGLCAQNFSKSVLIPTEVPPTVLSYFQTNTYYITTMAISEAIDSYKKS